MNASVLVGLVGALCAASAAVFAAPMRRAERGSSPSAWPGRLIAAALALTVTGVIQRIEPLDGALATRVGPTRRAVDEHARWGPGHAVLAVLPTLTAATDPSSAAPSGRRDAVSITAVSVTGAALLGEDGPGHPGGLLPFVGVTALMLALGGLVVPGSGLARALVAAGVLAAVAGPSPWVVLLGQLGALVGLSAAAGALVTWLHRRDDEADGPLPAYVSTGFGVALVGALGWTAFAAGTATDAAALAPFLERLADPIAARADVTLLARDAARLRHSLDVAALTGFVGLSALLAWLRWRRLPLALLLGAVAVADVVVAIPLD